MNICFLTGTIDLCKKEGTGGAPRQIIYLANYLQESANTSVMSVYKGDEDPQFPLSAKVNYSHLQTKIRHHTSKCILLKILFWLFILAKLAIYKFKRRRSYDLIISCSPALTLISIFLSLWTKEKIVVWEMVSIRRYHPIVTFIRVLFLRRAYIYVSSSEHDISYLKKMKISVVHIPNMNMHQADVKTNDATTAPSSHINYLAVGRLENQKGFDLLIQIMAQYDKFSKNWSLSIVGSGSQRDMLIEMIDNYGLGNRITLIPHAKSLDEYYKQADVFLLSSRYEGMPLVLLEAQGVGLPIISFDCLTGPSEVIDHEENGFLVEPGNIDEFVSSMLRIEKGTPSYVLLSKNSITKSQEFLPKNIVSKWKKIIN